MAAAYLALSGARVCVLERRHVIGGAAVTEEIVPGFKFSRASYLLRYSILTKNNVQIFKYSCSIFKPEMIALAFLALL